MTTKTSVFGWEHEPAEQRPHHRASRIAFASSRVALDEAFTQQSAIRQRQEPSFNRDAPNPLDRRLSAFAASWRSGLPDSLSAQELCAQFPRIANRLALCWSDASLAVRFIDALLVDQRGGRKGFPREVSAELVRLRAHSIRRAEPHIRLHR